MRGLVFILVASCAVAGVAMAGRTDWTGSAKCAGVSDVIDVPAADTNVDPAGECVAKEPVSRVTEFGTFEVYPDDYEGPLPRSADGVQRATVVTRRMRIIHRM